MPVSTETCPELDLTIFTTTGFTPFSELIQALKSFYAGSPTENVIWDCREAIKVNILSRELQTIVQYSKAQSGKRTKGKTALVANTTLKYGLARMTAIFSEIAGLPWKTEIFKTLDAAMAWITDCMQAETQLKN